jgi:hypothetical protein
MEALTSLLSGPFLFPDRSPALDRQLSGTLLQQTAASKSPRAHSCMSTSSAVSEAVLEALLSSPNVFMTSPLHTVKASAV